MHGTAPDTDATSDTEPAPDSEIDSDTQPNETSAGEIPAGCVSTLAPAYAVMGMALLCACAYVFRKKDHVSH